MADAVTTQVLYESPVEYVVKLTNLSDGTGESDVNKVDVSALAPATNFLVLEEIIYATDGMSARLEWDATTDVPFWVCPPNHAARIDFRKMGLAGTGNSNNAGAGVTGDVFLTTVGHSSGDSYVIILMFRKVSAAPA